ncbi:putative disease resistance protein RGA3, partial [Pistacia vera]|uniref:putative disease resistance protein RGA3 n=1 Tax=Pistacia vera TaxID=55513 RepID=UPI0012632748
EVKLVVGVDNEVKSLRSNLEAIEAVLVDAEERQVKEKTVRLWLDRLKHASYDIEDVLDEWNYATLKQQIEGPKHAAVLKKECISISIAEKEFLLILDDVWSDDYKTWAPFYQNGLHGSKILITT